MEDISLEETPKDDRDIDSTLNEQYISDVIKVSVLPEKKGSALWKHTEYEITSQKHKSSVERRFNDFLNLYQNFLRKHEFRMIARIPPKQFMLEAFIEERRIKLQRFLTLISQHPVLARDEMLKIFLTETSDRNQAMINAVEIDEENKLSQKHEFKLILEKQAKARKILNEILKIKRLIGMQFKRQIEIVDDFESLSGSLSTVIHESADNSMSDYSENFLKIHQDFDKELKEKQYAAVTERIELVIEIFTAFCDLTERAEESFKKEKTPTVPVNRWQKFQTVIKGSTSDNSEDGREKRMNYAVHCISEEFQFVLKYLKLIPSILLKFTHEQACIYSNIAKLLNDIVDAESDKLSSE